MMINKKSVLIFLAKLAEVYPIGNFKLAIKITLPDALPNQPGTQGKGCGV